MVKHFRPKSLWKGVWHPWREAKQVVDLFCEEKIHGEESQWPGWNVTLYLETFDTSDFSIIILYIQTFKFVLWKVKLAKTKYLKLYEDIFLVYLYELD